MKKNKLMITILSILNVCRSIMLVLSSILSKFLLDNAINNSLDKAIHYGILFATSIILNIVLTLIYFYIKHRFSLKIEVYYKKVLYDELLKKEVKTIKGIHTGELSNIYLQDLNKYRIGIVETIPSIFLYSSRFILAFIALIFFDWRLLIALLSIGLIGSLGAFLYSKKMKKAHMESLKSDGEVNSFIQESFENIHMVKALEANSNFSSSLNDKLNDNYSKKNKRNLIVLFGSGGLFTLMQITSALTLLYGVYALMYLGLTYGTLIGLIQIVSYFESPLTQVSSILNKYNAYKASKERIEKIFLLENDKEQIIIDDFTSIEFEDVSFSYDKEIFSHFSYKIEKNDTILIKGPSGRGKTTFLYLLLGFIKPEEGRIIVRSKDKIYDVDQVRSLFSYVSQTNILFSGSIKENFSLFIKDVKEEDIISSLKIAQVYDEIMEKNNKLDTKLNEKGDGLSIGQIQRILIAINLLVDHPILLLDEFTSSLDYLLERRIVENIASLNKTKIIVSHRNIDLKGAKELILD